MHSSFSIQTGLTHFNNLLMILFQFFLLGVLVKTIHAGEVFPKPLKPSSPVQPQAAHLRSLATGHVGCLHKEEDHLISHKRSHSEI